jgi:hypothetical protein
VYAEAVAPHEVVELARAAVRRLTDAAPTAGEARAVLASIERVGSGPPYTVAIAGDLAGRTMLLNHLGGEYLFDPARHDAARVMMTLRRGAATTVRARRRDGGVVQLTRTDGAVRVEEDPELDEPDGLDSRSGEESDLRTLVFSDRAATAGAGPGPVGGPDDRAAIQQIKPPWWAIWRWLALWIRTWLSRSRRLPAATGAVVVSSDPAALPAAPTSTMSAMSSVTSRVRSIARTVARATHLGDRRQQLVDTLRAWFSDDAVERLFVEVEGGPLPDKVVMIELPSGADARSLDAVVADACLVACGERGFAMTDQLETVLTIVPHLFAVGAAALPAGCDPSVRLLGGFDAAAPALASLAMIERAYAAGQRASAVLSSACTTLDRIVSDAEAGFRTRIQRLEAMRIASPDDYTAAALAQVRSAVVEHAHHRIRRALDQLDEAIEHHGNDWAARLRAAASVDALRTAAARLDQESPGVLQATQVAVQRALVDDLTEYAHARYHELVSALRQGSSRSDAVPSWLTIDVRFGDMTSGTKLGTVAPRMTSLFRSLEALKAEAVAQLEQRIAKLRQVASANLRDAEPRLEPAVTGTLAIALRAEVERHVAWLEARLARERLAIDAERAQVTVLALIRDTATSDRRELLVALDRLLAALP